MVMALMTVYKAMPLSLAIMLATVMTCGSCSCTDNAPSDLNTFVGKDKDQVLQAMGKPQAEERYDNVILDCACECAGDNCSERRNCIQLQVLLVPVAT